MLPFTLGTGQSMPVASAHGRGDGAGGRHHPITHLGSMLHESLSSFGLRVLVLGNLGLQRDMLSLNSFGGLAPARSFRASPAVVRFNCHIVTM